MSKFFKALEQAERERVLREQARRHEPGTAEVAQRDPAGTRESPTPPRSPVAGGHPSAPLVAERPEGDRVGRPEPVLASEHSASSAAGIEEHLVSLLVPTSYEAEQYRGLRHLVEQLHKTADLSILAVSSPETGDGKTTTAINLAGALAQAPEARVLLVDADLRQSTVGDHLGLGDLHGRGLVDAILAPGLALEDVARRLPWFNLTVLTAGKRPIGPYELLKSARLGEILEHARRRYDYVVLDTPPLVPFPDCQIIGKWVDGFLVVVAAHKTPRRLVEEALNVLDPAKGVGLIFNSDERRRPGYYSGASDRSPTRGWFGWRGRAAKKVRSSPRRQPSAPLRGAE